MRSWLLMAALAVAACSGPQLGAPPPELPTPDALVASIVRPVVQTLQGTARLEAYADGQRRSRREFDDPDEVALPLRSEHAEPTHQRAVPDERGDPFGLVHSELHAAEP